MAFIELGVVGKVLMCKRIMKAETSAQGDVPFYKIGTFGKKPDAFITWEKYEEYKEAYSFPKKEIFYFRRQVRLVRLLCMMENQHIFKIQILCG